MLYISYQRANKLKKNLKFKHFVAFTSIRKEQKKGNSEKIKKSLKVMINNTHCFWLTAYFSSC